MHARHCSVFLLGAICQAKPYCTALKSKQCAQAEASYCSTWTKMCLFLNNGPLYSNTVTGTLAVDGWAVTFWYSEERPGRAVAPPSPLLAIPNVTARPSTASVPTSYFVMGHYN